MALILLRHLEPKGGDGRCYGQTDLPLAEGFEDQALAVLAALPRFDYIVSSPLKRCWSLASLFGQMKGLSPHADERLREKHFGSWEGLLWDEIPRGEIDAWAADVWHAKPHGGESVSEVHARVREAFVDLSRYDGSTLVVTHAGVMRIALAKKDEDLSRSIAFGQFIVMPCEKE